MRSLAAPARGHGASEGTALSGYCKADAGRIWLPPVLWLMAGAVTTPADNHHGHAGPAATTRTINDLPRSTW